MSLEDKAKAAAKKVEGTVQEGAGNLAGDKEAEAEGKAKKAEGEAREGVEKAKDTVKDAIN
ncbi:CsbD family protein [Phormidium sp. CLA17]|uniref:CsbD family protein n=1 Tax=Leptolyngbya sp. Cla-17 TaxID=2803751 RepID=UPI001490F1AB|nr:CsbD family protein [Leptolyngbya sp. Cla-17]MBM0741088.1 CsbD family protein [Leptolyngbya sp. Cla-17]